MKKGMPLRIIFVVVLSQNEVHLGYFAGITMKKKLHTYCAQRLVSTSHMLSTS